jgi:hypothetical protein
VKLTLLAVLFTLTLSICSASFPAAQGPISRGIDQAEHAEAQSERNIPPPMTPRRAIDLDKLKRDAGELATLAQSVPPDVDQVVKGALPKDLSDKLKRIQKLAKQIQSQIGQ